MAQIERTGITDEESARRVLEAEGFGDLFVWSDTAGTRYPLHTHPRKEVRWVLSGRLVIVEEGIALELGPGDRVTTEAEVPHSAYVPEDVRYLCGSR